MPFDAVLFDKDGTLFDYAGTWNSWTADVIRSLTQGDKAKAQALADVLAFDLFEEKVLPHSFVVYATNAEVAAAMLPHLQQYTQPQLESLLSAKAGDAPLVEAVPLGAFLDELLSENKRLGVMTNDSEESALSQLARAGVQDRFDFIAGFDSGHGAKPDPDPLLAFSRAVDIEPARCVMVGDSLHDLHAGRAAGMGCIGVLTGTALRAELAPHADVVLENIGQIPRWMKENR